MSVTSTLVRHDPARSVLLRALLTCLAVGLLLRATPDLGRDIPKLELGSLPGGFAPMYLVLTAMVAVFVLSAAPWTRCSRLALGLPIAARRLWLVRTSWMVAICVASVAVLTAALGLTVGAGGGGFTLNQAIAMAAARAVVTVVLVLFLVQLPWPEVQSIPVDAEYVAFIIPTIVLTVAFSTFGLTSPAGTVFLLAITAALGVWLAIRMPAALILPSPPPDPYATASETVSVGSGVGPDAAPSRLTIHSTLFRALTNNLPAWAMLLGFVMFSALATAEFFSGDNAFVAIAFLVVWQLSITNNALQRMVAYDHLPISRALLWAHATVPFAVAIVVGAGIVLVQVWLNPARSSPVSFEKCCVHVPWEYLELTRDGSAPTVTAPWGESHTPELQPLWKGGSLALYDPFEVAPDSSPEFVELQLERAVQTVYGIRVSPEVREPGHQSPGGIAGGVEGGAVALEAARGRPTPDRSRSAAVALMLGVLLSTSVVIANLLRVGSPRCRRLFTWASTGALIVIGMVVAAFVIARLAGLVETWHVGALMSLGIRSLSHRVPVSTPVLWVCTVTVWVLNHLIRQRVFNRIELPARSLVGRFAEEY
jgi:hypothetical protein